MRREFAAALVFAVAASCGDSTPKPAAPAAEPAPFEATFDDAALEDRVFVAAASGRLDELASLELPARCDRVRVAVRALHDDLLGARKPSPELPRLLDALDALSKAQGGASAASLGPLVAAWRKWTPAEVAAETDLAARATRCADALAAEKLSAPTLASHLAGASTAPPSSPAIADLAMVRAAILLDASDDAVPQEAYDHALKLYEGLGWPGGFGSFAEPLARRFLNENPKSFRGNHLADSAIAAYGRHASKDELRASLVLLFKAQIAERAGDLKTAEYRADGARLRILPTGARGREMFEVMRLHGDLAQRLGTQRDAARDLGRAWDEAKWAKLDAAVRVGVAEPLATALYQRGQFAQARDLVREAAALVDDDAARARLEQTGGEAAIEARDFAAARELYGAAASRLAKLAQAGKARRFEADEALVLAARATLKAGDAAGGRAAMDAVLAKQDLHPSVRASAAAVLRETGDLDRAEKELALADAAGGAEFAASTSSDRARLAAARGDAAAARRLFAEADDRFAHAPPEAHVALDAARLLVDWARMEMDLGRNFEASELAGRAVNAYRDLAGLDLELDRARKLYVDVFRRRLVFAEAEKATLQRLAAGPPGDDAVREDALLDLLLIRIELVFERTKDAEAKALAAAEMFAQGPRRELAKACVLAAREGVAVRDRAPASSTDASPRWRLLRDVAAIDGDPKELVERCGAAEPELRRRLVPRLLLGEGNPSAQDLLRRPDATTTSARKLVEADDESAIYLAPRGDHGTELVLTKDGATGHALKDDAGFGAFADACRFEPTSDRLASTSRRAADALRIDDVPAGVRRLWISLPEPLGPLPYDLLPYKDGTLLDSFEVCTVNSLTELVAARSRRAPPTIELLPSPYSTLETRYAVVQVAEVDPVARARFFALVAKSRAAGKDASAAVREAKLALRAEWKPDPKRPAAVPPWAAFLLRGTP